MEASGYLLPRDADSQVRGIAEIDSGHDQEDAYAALTRVGARWSSEPQGLSRNPTQGGILAHEARTEPKANFEIDVGLGNKTSRALWDSQGEQLSSINKKEDDVCRIFGQRLSL